MPKQKSKEKILPSELRVLERMSNNFKCNNAADKLFISPHTAYTELRNARKRNKLENNIALFLLAVEEGLIPVNIKNQSNVSDSGNRKYTFSDALRLALLIANNKLPNFRY